MTIATFAATHVTPRYIAPLVGAALVLFACAPPATPSLGGGRSLPRPLGPRRW